MPKNTKANRALVGILGGSTSDFPILEKAVAMLNELGISNELLVVSAHRTPDRLFAYAEQAVGRGIQVIIAGAGGAAHLPGMVAAKTPLPVIGVPIPTEHLRGLDSLLSIVQMPRGIPVATVAIGGAENAAILAAQILGLQAASVRQGVERFRAAQTQAVLDSQDDARLSPPLFVPAQPPHEPPAVNVAVIGPGATLGVLGGGQLGAMFATVARRMGYAIAVWDPDPEAPAHRIADYSLIHPFTDADARTEFTGRVRAVTYEWENVPADLCEQLERDVPVRPSSRVLRVIQDRIEQKTYLRNRGLPVPAFSTLSSPEELGRQTMPPYPLVCKTATAGYDGKGQWKILRAEDCLAVQRELARNRRPDSRWILEEWLPFERELSILVVRGADGASQSYPLVENVHEEGILRQTVVPADVPEGVAQCAGTMARDAVQALDGVGVFCVELFLMPGGRLVINEIAPRPHNSGHYTLDACTVSQFEQQVRTLCGLPMGEVRLLSPAVMLNLIGDDVRLVTGSPAVDLLVVPGAIVHLYGKRMIRPKRKMGHISFLAPTRAEALTAASTFRSRCAQTQP